jgi:hypothetical protein
MVDGEAIYFNQVTYPIVFFGVGPGFINVIRRDCFYFNVAGEIVFLVDVCASC